MKFIVIDDRKIDMFTKEFDDLNEAIKECEYQWNHMTNSEKQNDCNSMFVIKSINPDEDAENHYDGDFVYVIKLNGNEIKKGDGLRNK